MSDLGLTHLFAFIDIVRPSFYSSCDQLMLLADPLYNVVGKEDIEHGV